MGGLQLCRRSSDDGTALAEEIEVTTKRAFSTADFKISDLPGQKAAGEAGGAGGEKVLRSESALSIPTEGGE